MHSLIRATLPALLWLVVLPVFHADYAGLETPARAPLGPSPGEGDAPDADWRTAALSLIQAREYEFSFTDRGLQAPNRAQNFRTYLGHEGIQVTPREDHDLRWSWAWSTQRWGREEKWREVTRDSPRSEGSRATYESPGITEWFLNGKDGLEHGYTVHARPPGTGPLRIEGAVRGGLRAELDDTGDAVDFFDENGVRLLRYAGLKVWDAAERPLSARMEVSGEFLALVVDDTGARYPVTVDPTLTAPAWSSEGNQASGLFGAAVGTAGDVNGDGFSDAVIGAPWYDSGQSEEGLAFVFYGSISGLPASPSWTGEIDHANAFFGWSAETAGDVNGDGFDDLIIGAMYDTGTQNGSAYLFFGSAAGLADTAGWVYTGGQSGELLGNAVSTAGDVNGDGFDDVIVGAWYYDGGETDAGRAYVFHGSTSGLESSPAWMVDGDQGDAHFGTSVFTAGDVNGDGHDDVVVGAPLYDAGLEDQGRAYVYLGSASGLSAVPSWTRDGTRTDGNFGQSVSTAGDMNGDGYSDVVIGAPGEYGFSLVLGQAHVFHGSASGLGAAAAWTRSGLTLDGELGEAVSTAGDVNGDGYADVVLGDPGYQSNKGIVIVAFGSETLPYPTVQIDGYPGARTGSAVGTAGDVNGDGFSDIFVGSIQYSAPENDEGRVDLYLGCGLNPTTAETWAMEGDQTFARLGASVAGAGDVNGDGFDDVIIGASGYDGGESQEGAVFAYHGSATGLDLIAAWSAEGNQVISTFGLALDGAGDVNGDGFDDVIIGAPRYDGGAENGGAVFVYMGSATGLEPSPDWTLYGYQAHAYYGQDVAGAGDVNGDGLSDVVLGASGYGNPEPGEGRAELFLGSYSGLEISPAWTAESNQSGAQFGHAVAGAGDVNGDGFSDVVVGAPLFSLGESQEGAAFLYLGSPTGLGAISDWAYSGNQASAWLGDAVATAGDVNGDGYSDLLVGAYGYDAGTPNSGLALLFFGSSTGLGPLADWSQTVGQADAFFGDAVAPAGDVNGDGYDDVVVGAPYYTGDQADEGVARLFLGSPTGPALFDWEVEGNQASALFGSSVTSAGDVNGDGFSDILVGAPLYDNPEENEGRAYLYLGNGGDGHLRMARQKRTDGSAPVAFLGKSDATDAFLLSVRGRSAGGRSGVQLLAEVKTAGTPFDGTGVVTGPESDSGTSGIDLEQLITGLSPDTGYRWRLRVVSDSPFFPRSPWSSPQETGTATYSLRTAQPVTGIGEPDGKNAGRVPVVAAPNPFRAATRISFDLETEAPVRVAVYDIAGREIAVLSEGRLPAGPHAVSWAGRDAAGRGVASGVYLARVIAGSRTMTRKLVLSR